MAEDIDIAVAEIERHDDVKEALAQTLTAKVESKAVYSTGDKAWLGTYG